MKKRVLTGALVLCLMCGLLTLPTAAADTETGVIQAIQALGIMIGDQNGDMALDRPVTRAEFAKMLTAASSYKDTVSEEGSGYSLFKDVKSSHWASEYIKIALDAGWMIGYTDGTFRPDNTITLEEACTAALRLLGFNSANLAGSFPSAQLSKAAALGLRDQIALSQGDQMKRRDCMYLFYDLMTAQTSAGQTYAVTLGYTLNDSGELDYSALVAKDLKGPYTTSSGALSLPFTAKAIYKAGSAASSAEPYDVYYYNANLKSVYLYDTRVTGVYNAAFPGAAAPSSVTVDGQNYSIETSNAAYKLSTAGEFSIGDAVTLLLGMDGKVADVVSTSELMAEDANLTEIISAGLKGPYTAGVNGMDLPFAAAEASIYKDGSLSTAASVNQYDIYYYNPSMKVVYVYSDRVAGTYTQASPSQAAPTSVTVAGNTYALGSSTASYKLSTLGGCSLGDTVMLLLGMDGTVVDVVTGSAIDAMYYGVVQSAQKTVDPVNGSAVNVQLTVACTDGQEYAFLLPATVSYSAGQLVSVSVTGGETSVKRLSERTLSGSVDTAASKLGSYAFAENIQILETSDTGAYLAIAPSRLAGYTLSSSHVRYYALDESGKISHLILNDATGDTWSYGYMISTSINPVGQEGLNFSSSYTYIMNGKTSTLMFSNLSYPVTAGGFAVCYEDTGSVKTMRNTSSVQLTELGMLTAKADNKIYSIADNVQVYLRQGGSYYLTDLSGINVEDYTLTGYYDSFGCPAGGRIRVIIATEKT